MNTLDAASTSAPLRTRARARTATTPLIWGLTPREIHDAFWHSRGVQCVRRGERCRLQRAAELYLLIDPGQLVLFDLAPLIERLAWQNALVTRLRLTDHSREPYSERIITDRLGQVERIERRYRPRTRGSAWVILTASRRIASTWMAAGARREGWNRVRRSVAWSRVDHWRCRGACLSEHSPRDCKRLLHRLVVRWVRPDLAIEGIESTGEGVWRAIGDVTPNDAIIVGPVWLGRGGSTARGGCIIGPAWIGDRRSAASASASMLAPARVRDIAQIDPGESRKLGPTAPPQRLAYRAAKRTFDLLCSAAALLATLPLFAIIMLAILLEDGRPVFYGHVRQTRGGGTFRCWKFRTMDRNADRMVAALRAQNVCDGPQVFIKDDPRVTRVGRVLRALHLDELPQFWNVLVGHMSIVGPRPSPDGENQYCPAWRELRLSVRPGITGLWQLRRTRAPGEDFQEWIKYDIDYVRRANFALDVRICAQTLWMILFRRR